jgi:hypothetical protein
MGPVSAAVAATISIKPQMSADEHNESALIRVYLSLIFSTT